eukprot:1193928-Rhodomonas_salina.1
MVTYLGYPGTRSATVGLGCGFSDGPESWAAWVFVPDALWKKNIQLPVQLQHLAPAVGNPT